MRAVNPDCHHRRTGPERFLGFGFGFGIRLVFPNTSFSLFSFISMALLLLEALGALALLLFIVWWTMFSGRKNGELPSERLDDDGGAAPKAASKKAADVVNEDEADGGEASTKNRGTKGSGDGNDSHRP